MTRWFTSTRRPAIALAAAALALSGCAAADLHPGAAAVVGDEQISLEQANELAADYCALLAPSLQQDGRSVSLGEVRGLVLDTFVRDLLLHEYAEQEGIDPSIGQAVAQAEADAEGNVPDGTLDTYVEFQEALAYAEAVFTEVGSRELPGDAPPQEVVAAGQQEFQAWVEDQEFTLDPRFGSFDAQNAFIPGGDQLSVPVSDLAVLGSTASDPGQPNAEYAAALPESQTCG